MGSSELEYWKNELVKVAANAAEESGWENLEATLSRVVDAVETVESMGLAVSVASSGQSMSHYVNAEIAGDDVCLFRISDHSATGSCRSNAVISINVTDRFSPEVARIRALRKRCACCEHEAPLSARSCAEEKFPTWEFFV